MHERRFAASAAMLVLLALPVADFVRSGKVADTLVGGLLILAFGGGGFAADRAVKARLRKLADRYLDEGGDDDSPPV